MLTSWKVGEPLRCTSLKGRGGVGQLFLGFHLCHFSCRDKLAELHGNMFVEECVKCGKYVSCEPGGGAAAGGGFVAVPRGRRRPCTCWGDSVWQAPSTACGASWADLSRPSPKPHQTAGAERFETPPRGVARGGCSTLGFPPRLAANLCGSGAVGGAVALGGSTESMGGL